MCLSVSGVVEWGHHPTFFDEGTRHALHYFTKTHVKEGLLFHLLTHFKIMFSVSLCIIYYRLLFHFTVAYRYFLQRRKTHIYNNFIVGLWDGILLIIRVLKQSANMQKCQQDVTLRHWVTTYRRPRVLLGLDPCWVAECLRESTVVKQWSIAASHYPVISKSRTLTST